MHLHTCKCRWRLQGPCLQRNRRDKGPGRDQRQRPHSWKWCTGTERFWKWRPPWTDEASCPPPPTGSPLHIWAIYSATPAKTSPSEVEERERRKRVRSIRGCGHGRGGWWGRGGACRWWYQAWWWGNQDHSQRSCQRATWTGRKGRGSLGR